MGPPCQCDCCRSWRADLGEERSPVHPRAVGELVYLASPMAHPEARVVAGEHGDRALRLYRRYLRDAILRREPRVLSALEEITGEHSLVCSCAPRPCHADVIRAAWRWWRTSLDEGRELTE